MSESIVCDFKGCDKRRHGQHHGARLGQIAWLELISEGEVSRHLCPDHAQLVMELVTREEVWLVVDPNFGKICLCADPPTSGCPMHGVRA